MLAIVLTVVRFTANCFAISLFLVVASIETTICMTIVFRCLASLSTIFQSYRACWSVFLDGENRSIRGKYRIATVIDKQYHIKSD